MTHSCCKSWLGGARGPGGARVLGSLFQVADRLTVEVAMLSSDASPHPTKKKKEKETLPFFAAFQLEVRIFRVIFELFVLCLPSDHTSLSCVNCKHTGGLAEQRCGWNSAGQVWLEGEVSLPQRATFLLSCYRDKMLNVFFVHSIWFAFSGSVVLLKQR